MDLDTATAVLAEQPFSVLVGARAVAVEAGRVVLEVPLRDDLRNRTGYLHGGVVAYLADNALALAAGSVFGAGMLTTGLTVDFLRPADGDLVATAVVVSTTARVAVCRCELTVDDVVVAVAQATLRLATRPT